MNIFIPCPGFGKHGGIRVIIEIANRLAEHHKVFFWSLQGNEGKNYWNFHKNITFTDKGERVLRDCDILFITSPHSVSLEHVSRRPKKVFHHLQMLEHMFYPGNRGFLEKCKYMYKSPFPLFSISEWNIRELKTTFKRTGETIYIGNGVNTSDFPIVKFPEKDDKQILIEGWESYSSCKDTENLSHVVARKLKEDGYKIVSYGILPLKSDPELLDEYHMFPSKETMNTLYERSKVLIKASRYDARACAPVEAMTKATPTVRALIEGDDDLIHEFNCLRSNYLEGPEKLYENAKKLLTNPEMYGIIQENCYKHLEENSWDRWMTVILNRIEQ